MCCNEGVGLIIIIKTIWLLNDTRREIILFWKECFQRFQVEDDLFSGFVLKLNESQISHAFLHPCMLSLCCKSVLNWEAFLWTPSNTLHGRESSSWVDLVASAHRFAPTIITASTRLICCSHKKKSQRNGKYARAIFTFPNSRHRYQCTVVAVWLITWAWTLDFTAASLAPLSCLSVNVTVGLPKGVVSAGWRQLFVCSQKGQTLSVCLKRASGHRLWLSVCFSGGQRVTLMLNIIFSLSVDCPVSPCASWQCWCYMRIFILNWAELWTGIFIIQGVIYSHFICDCGDYRVYFGV